MQLELQIAFSKIHSVVIGPGLGRSETSFKALKVDIGSFEGCYSFYIEFLSFDA